MKHLTSNILLQGLAASALLFGAAACGSRGEGWTLNGTIANGAGKDLIVETQSFAGWMPVDTVTLDDKGSFSVVREPKGYPDIYRFRIDGATVYFPIDSIETITVGGSLPGLEENFTLEGSDDATAVAEVDHAIAATARRLGPEKAATDSTLKRSLADVILRNPGGIASYYIVNRQVGGKPVFSTARPLDLRIIGAVANAYTLSRPDDPRTKLLSEAFLANRTTKADTVAAKTIGLHEIDLYDNNGTERKLSETADRSRMTLLNFTVYAADESPAVNRALNAAYERYKSSGLEIYQIALDDDEVAWRTAAANLPWITVRNAGSEARANLLKYNVVNLPTTYIIDGNGEIVDRVDDLTGLDQAIARHMR